jgi:negative regulator of sigma E activity
MSARDFDELLSAYLDGEVTPEERAAVEQRLEQSPALRETLEELSEVGDLVRSLPRARPPADLPERVVTAISTKPLAARTAVMASQHGLWGRIRGWHLATAGTIVAAGIAVAVLWLPEQAALERPVATNDSVSATRPVSLTDASDFVAPYAESTLALDSMDRAVRDSDGTYLNGRAETESLTWIVEHLNRKPELGEVLRTLRDNAGQTQLLQYTVVDVNESARTLKTIFANNSFDIVVTETPTPPLAPVAVDNRVYFYLEGSAEQIGQTLQDFETIETVKEVDDYGILAQEADKPTTVELFADAPATANSFSLGREKSLAEAAPLAAAPAPVAEPQSQSAKSQVGIEPARPAPPSVAARRLDESVVDQKAAQPPSDPADLRQMVKKEVQAPPAAGPASIPLPVLAGSAVEAAKPGNAPAVANPFGNSAPVSNFGGNQRGVSAQLDAQATVPIVDKFLGDRALSNSASNNAVQNGAARGYQRPLFRNSRSGGNAEGAFRARSFNAPQSNSPQSEAKQLAEPTNEVLESKDQLPVKAGEAQENAGRPAGNAVANSRYAQGSPQQALSRAIIILQTSPVEPAAASPPPAAPKAKAD